MALFLKSASTGRPALFESLFLHSKTGYSLIEMDILNRIAAYLSESDPLERQKYLESLVNWLDRPLFIWDILEEAVHNQVFADFILAFHEVCELYQERKQTEWEVLTRITRLYQNYLKIESSNAPTQPELPIVSPARASNASMLPPL